MCRFSHHFFLIFFLSLSLFLLCLFVVPTSLKHTQNRYFHNFSMRLKFFSYISYSLVVISKEHIIHAWIYLSRKKKLIRMYVMYVETMLLFFFFLNWELLLHLMMMILMMMVLICVHIVRINNNNKQNMSLGSFLFIVFKENFRILFFFLLLLLLLLLL